MRHSARRTASPAKQSSVKHSAIALLVGYEDTRMDTYGAKDAMAPCPLVTKCSSPSGGAQKKSSCDAALMSLCACVVT